LDIDFDNLFSFAAVQGRKFRYMVAVGGSADKRLARREGYKSYATELMKMAFRNVGLTRWACYYAFIRFQNSLRAMMPDSIDLDLN